MAKPVNRLAVGAAVVVVTLAVNLVLYTIGRAAGGSFVYTHPKPTTVDALSIAIMTAAPLAVGLALLAWLSPRWPALLTAAKMGVPIVAIATIGLMTVPAHFDRTSTIFLSAMHFAFIPATLFAVSELRNPVGGARRRLVGRRAAEEVIGAGQGHV